MATFTAGASKPIDPQGELYQRRAFRALPILVRQALAGQPIYYSDIASELEMDNPRNMNYVLGSIGNSLRTLTAEWGRDIPPLQALVINKADELPGPGFAEFAPDPVSFRMAPLRIKRQVVDGLLATVYSYNGWQSVLAYFGITLSDPPGLADLLPALVVSALGRSGESDAHRDFKNFVAEHPAIIGLSKVTPSGSTEHLFPSGDTVDVLFTTAKEFVAVEVKSRISSDFDILRGVFQCVKYQALLDAVVAVERRNCDTRTVLVLQGELPKALRPIANTLGVTVLERVGINPRAT